MATTVVIENEQIERGARPERILENVGVQRTRVLIVGAGAVGQTLAKNLLADGRYDVIGFVDDENPLLEADSPRILGNRDDAAKIVRQYEIDEVLLAYVPTWQQKLTEELAARRPNVKVSVVPSPFEAMMRVGSVENYGDIALVRLKGEASRFTATVKRATDIVIALAVLAFCAPMMALIAALIRITSAGSPMFAQTRVGRYGKPFTLYKFRTMRIDAERITGPVLASGKEDMRLTTIGRWLRLFRVDELPQFWNVLRGEMSLIGPRPERPCFVETFQMADPMYARRHQVRPGITGLAQVCGGYHTDYRDKLRFDLTYVAHQSLWMDLSILVRTLLVCFNRSGH